MGGHWQIFGLLPMDRVEPTPYQRDLSPTHVKRLTEVVRKIDRFVDPITRARISLDTDITVPAVNHELFDSASPLPLDAAVVEIKGRGSDMPRVLRHLTTLGGRKTSFSKYLACYHHVVNGVGR